MLLAVVLGLLRPVDLITGIVTDPQDRVVIDAQLVIDCGAGIETLRTDSKGRFAFSKTIEAGNCSLTVTHPGFATLTQTILKAEQLVVLQLHLARTKTSTDVFVSDDLDLKLHPPINSSSLNAVELKRISNNTSDLVRFAKALAGTTLGSDNIYIDGLPAGALPPAAAIARISVNIDPFSAEYSDPDENHIEITTKSPDRHFDFNVGGGALGFGGRSVLAPDGPSASRSVNLGASGPLPRAFGFSLAADLSESRRQELTAPGSSSIQSLLLTAHYSPSEAAHANVSINDFASKDSNVGVVGFTSPEAGVQTDFRTREYRAIWERISERFSYRSGFQLHRTASNNLANSDRAGVAVIGGFVEGGNPISETRFRRGNWTWKNTLHSESGRRWAAGFEISHFATTDYRIPNIHGVFQVAAGKMSWFVHQNYGEVRRETAVAAPFVQVDVAQSDRFVLRAGLRGEHQADQGLFFSPRMFMAAQRGRTLFRAGTGLFVESLSNDILLRAAHNGIAIGGRSVLSQLDSRLTRARKSLTKASIEDRLGDASYGLEYSLTAGSRLLGSYRRAHDAGFADVLTSDRRSARHQLHATFQYQKSNQSVVAHYEWIRAQDNTDGPFSFPAIQEDLAAEWARTSGVSVQNVDLVGNFSLPRAVSLSVVGKWRSSIPYNITTAEDPFEQYLYADRGGRSRNSGSGPRSRTVSLFAHRQTRYAGLGLQLENVFSTTNYLSLGSVVDSPLFGRPLGALPGRALRFWFSLGF